MGASSGDNDRVRLFTMDLSPYNNKIYTCKYGQKKTAWKVISCAFIFLFALSLISARDI